MNPTVADLPDESIEPETPTPRRFRKIALTGGIREAAGNIAWLGGDRILRLGGGLLVGTIVARYLGPSPFGVINYATAIFAMFNTIAGLGLDSLVVREIALNPDFENELLGTAFSLKVLASCITTLAAICFAKLMNPADNTTLQIIVVLSCAGIFQSFDVVDYFLQAKVRSRYSIIPKSAIFVAASLIRLVAVSRRQPLMTFVWITAVETVFSELGLAGAYVRFHRKIMQWRFDLTRAKDLLRESWPLMCSSVLILIYMRCDQIILGTLSTTTAVGIYSASTKISEIWYAIPTIICASVMPKLMKTRESAPALFAIRLQHLYTSMVVCSVSIAILAAFFGKYAILLAYGQKYLAATPILSIQIWTAVFVFLGIVGSQQMTYEKLITIQLQRAVLGTVLNICLNILLVPRYGVLGSAVATLIVQAIMAYVYDCFSPSTRHIFLLKTRALNPLLIFGFGK